MLEKFLNGFILFCFIAIIVDVALSHIKTHFNKNAMWIPIITIPSIIVSETIYLFNDSLVIKYFVIISLFINLLIGLLGSYFHYKAGAFRDMSFMKKLIFGPPVLAALQISALAFLGIIFAIFL